MNKLVEDSSVYEINISPQLLKEFQYSRQNYGRKFMLNAARTLLKTYGFDYKSVKIVDSLSNTVFETIEKYGIIILFNDSNYWESFIIVKKDGSFKIFQINPFDKYPRKIEADNVILDMNNKKTPFDENIDKAESGLYVLGFLYVFLKINNKFLRGYEIKKEMLDNMMNFNYEPARLKIKILNKLASEMVSTLNQKVEFVAKNKEFIKKYKNLIETCSILKDTDEILSEYREKLKNNEDAQQLKEELIKKIDKFVKDNTKKDSDTNKDDVSIQKDYPTETEVLSTVFSVIINMPNKEDELKKHCMKLEIDPKKVMDFYKDKFKNVSEDNNEVSDTPKNEENMTPLFIGKSNANVDFYDEKVKTMKQLISEMENTGKANKSLNYKYFNLNFEKIDEYCKKWENKTKVDIDIWTKNFKSGIERIINDHGNKEQETEREIYEAIAVFNRAFQIIKGRSLRSTQKIALLVFLRRPVEKGLLCQIQTGEGKTYIIAALAILKILLNKNIKYVDIITSNPVLADEAVMSCKDMYNFFNITVDTNNKQASGPKMCYSANVVYGTMASFQFDFLNHDFNGRGIRNISDNSSDKERQFQCVILDEVDNMLIDNSGNIAKLSESFPGMDCLKYIYIEIWQDLNKFLQNKYNELVMETKDHEELLRDPNTFFNHVIKLYPSIIEEWKNSIKLQQITAYSLILPHLKQYAESSFNKWLENAVRARFDCLEDINYVLENKTDDGRTELVVVPVDYTNTGVTLKNTVWSHGLHQFIQLKHNLQVTTETLTSCCVSNYAYILKYDKNIFGLTGTLGGLAEQRLLSNIYNINYASIPTYKKKSFDELEGKIVKDTEWVSTIIQECLEILDCDRAILIVCLTIADAQTIHKHLKRELADRKWLQLIDNYNIKCFFKEDDSYVTHEVVGPRSIIVATNIAGRGTDLKTDENLENNGGLHVCVGFCPENERVRDQVYYRTSRQGNNGSARIICRQSDIFKQLDDDFDVDGCDFSAVYEKINSRECIRMDILESIKVKELRLQDNLFQLFSDLYKRYKQSKKISIFALADLKEFWTFWFEIQNFSGLPIDDLEICTRAEELFKQFKQEGENILKGEISHNPYYYISNAQILLSGNNVNEAKLCLEKAKHLNFHTENCICPLHYSISFLLFEIALESGNIFWNQLKEYLGKALFLDKIFKKSFKDNSYKSNALDQLMLVEKSLKIEIDHVNNYFISDDFKQIINMDNSNNALIEHLRSRLYCLYFFRSHVTNICATLEDYSNNNNNKDVIIKQKSSNYLLEMKPTTDDEKQIHGHFCKTEILELQLRCLNTFYEVAPVAEVDSQIVKAAVVQIGLGVGVLTISSLFPISLVFGEPIAATFISEGIMDIIISICGVPLKLNRSYFVSKLIAHAINIISIGLANIMSFCGDIISRARTIAYNYFQSLHQTLNSFIRYIRPILEFFSSTANMCLSFLSELQGCFRAVVPRRIFTGPIMQTMYLTSIRVTKFLMVTNILSDLYVDRFKMYFFKMQSLINNFVQEETQRKVESIKMDIANVCVSKEYYNKMKLMLEEWNLDLYQNYINVIARSVIVHTDYAVLIHFLQMSVEKFFNGIKPFIVKLIELTINLIKELRVETGVGEVLDRIDTRIIDSVLDGLNFCINKLSTQENIECDNFLAEEEILSENDPYKILGLNPEEKNLEMVRRSYIKLARKYRPGIKNLDTKRISVFNKISDAYEQIKTQIQAGQNLRSVDT